MYLEFFRKAFQERYAYRFNLIVTALGSLLTLWAQVFIWMALLAGDSTEGINIASMLSYVIISAIIMTLTSTTMSYQLGQKVQTGDIMMDFLRPISLKNYLFADNLGNNIFQVSFITLPAAIITGLIFGFEIPDSALNILLFLPSLVIGVLISFYFHYLVGLLAFWLETTWYIPFFTGALIQLFSGATIPLWFYPEWLYQITEWLPFRLIFFEPISILLGERQGLQLLTIFSFQVMWVGILWLVERFLWKRVQTKIVVNGG